MRKFYANSLSDSTHFYDDSYQTHIILAKRLHSEFSVSLDREDLPNDNNDLNQRYSFK
jgi:hypothetical protein